MEDVSAFQYYHGDSKKKKKGKKSISAQDKETIAKELAMMKSYLAKQEATSKLNNQEKPDPVKVGVKRKHDNYKSESPSQIKAKKKKRKSKEVEPSKQPVAKASKIELVALKKGKQAEVSNVQSSGLKDKKGAKVETSPKQLNGRNVSNGSKNETPQLSKKAKKKAAAEKSLINGQGQKGNQSESQTTSSNKKSKKTINPTEKALPNDDGGSKKLSKKRQSEDVLQSSSKKKLSKTKISNVEEEEEIPTLVPIATPEDFVDEEEPGSVEVGHDCFEWMIHPVDAKDFFGETFDKRPLHIKRDKPNYYDGVFSTSAFDNILRKKEVFFTKNLDVTIYEDGKRSTLNPEGRAYPPVVWDYYNTGCSLRLLNPQTFNDRVWKLCSTLQDFLGSMVGANIYLTPPGTQGFAPHFDDVDVFILQLEGKKRWRLYEPRTANEKLARLSSRNFEQSEIGKPIKDFILEAGDMVYLPRGTIHQGTCLEDAHSLHITISCHQLNTFGDFLEKLLPDALKVAMEEDVSFREGLPRDFLGFMGVANTEKCAKKRAEFTNKVKGLLDKLFTYASVDFAADQFGKRFMRDVLPPHLTPFEKVRCCVNGGERWDPKQMKAVNKVELGMDTEVRLIRAHCLRIVTEENDTVRLYHCVENSREFHERDEQFIEIQSNQAAVVDALINAYPAYTKLSSLPSEDLDIVQMMWESKLLITKEPLYPIFDDSEEDSDGEDEVDDEEAADTSGDTDEDDDD